MSNETNEKVGEDKSDDSTLIPGPALNNDNSQIDQGKGWRPGDRLQVAVVSFSHTIQHGYVAALGVAYPFVLADFHVSYAVLGIILGAAGIVGGLLQGLAAYLLICLIAH